ncbi:RNA 2'-phosphotransferase [Abeliophyllum distichum]|uniref:2'-phosphotransferase n=1 Tax=Abeliophyllum distichum TaxID=126358 RepID=A0ABD1UEX7_9LAMI
MWASLTNSGLRILRFRLVYLPLLPTTTLSLLHSGFRTQNLMDSCNNLLNNNASFTASASSSRRTRILRHMASELKLDMRSDGYVKVQDLLKLNLKTFANIPLHSHTVDDVREAVRKDNKQRFSLLEENGELLICANQGHTIVTVETESLLKPILSPEKVPVCVHGTHKKNLESILEHGLKCMKRLHVHFSCGLPTDGDVISEGMKLYMSDNKVILTEGFDGVVPVKFFQKIESWPKRELIPF